MILVFLLASPEAILRTGPTHPTRCPFLGHSWAYVGGFPCGLPSKNPKEGSLNVHMGGLSI